MRRCSSAARASQVAASSWAGAAAAAAGRRRRRRFEDDASSTRISNQQVCGLPLFEAPKNRSLADFEADTDEHGWPSFRTAELVAENVVTNGTQVTSACGTHLGTYDPDDAGPRWCIDLSCIAGRPSEA